MVRIEKGPDGKLRQALVDSTQGAPSPSDKCSLGS
jgi:hypothetical protein